MPENLMTRPVIDKPVNHKHLVLISLIYLFQPSQDTKAATQVYFHIFHAHFFSLINERFSPSESDLAGSLLYNILCVPVWLSGFTCVDNNVKVRNANKSKEHKLWVSKLWLAWLVRTWSLNRRRKKNLLFNTLQIFSFILDTISFLHLL